MTSKPTVVWLEQLAASGGAEIPTCLAETFNVRHATSTVSPNELIDAFKPAAIFFDFDYPDRHRLAIFAQTKRERADVPVVMVTLQHSESLPIWAYRNGALDYLVKPVDSGELNACIDRLLEIITLKNESGRNAARVSAPIPDDVPHLPRSTKDRLAPAVFYVQQNFNRHLYSDAVARLCNMSASHFSHAFRKTYGLTFQEFLLRYRVNRACRLLATETSPKIAEVAFAVGFSDPSYFTRVFKRYIGVAPSSYTATISIDEVVDGLRVPDEDELTSSSQVVRQLSESYTPKSA